MSFRVPALLLFANVLAITPSAFGQNSPAAPASVTPVVFDESEFTVEQITMPGTNVRAGRVTTEFHAPFALVAETLLDFERYKEFLPQVTESRIVQRRRGQVDFYLRITLLNDLGILFALLRFTIQRGPGTLALAGQMVSGNFARFEYRMEATEIPGTGRTRVMMQALATPRFPFPDAIVSRSQVYWATQGLMAFRAHAESRAAGPTAPRASASVAP